MREGPALVTFFLLAGTTFCVAAQPKEVSVERLGRALVRGAAGQ